jgi:hypothetical protein
LNFVTDFAGYFKKSASTCVNPRLKFADPSQSRPVVPLKSGAGATASQKAVK